MRPTAPTNEAFVIALALDDLISPLHPNISIYEGEDILVHYTWNGRTYDDTFQGVQLTKYSHQSRY